MGSEKRLATSETDKRGEFVSRTWTHSTRPHRIHDVPVVCATQATNGFSILQNETRWMTYDC